MKWNVCIIASLGLFMAACEGEPVGVENSAATAEQSSAKPIQTKSGRRAAIEKAAKMMAEEAKLDGGGELTLKAGTTANIPGVPHYFGPFPNWANSPLTLPAADVVIEGDGLGAAATAAVGAGGAVTGITVTNPGSGYTTAQVTILGGDGLAAAAATVSSSGGVSSINVDQPGAGYTAPLVALNGGGTTLAATATAYGGVDAVTLVDPGAGYTVPTVDFDLPDGPDGVAATAHAVVDAEGNITEIVVDQPGSGYSYAPNVVVRDGTIFDPAPNGGTGAAASASLAIQTIAVDTVGEGYTSAPTVDISDPTGTGAAATAVADVGSISGITVTAGGSGYVTPGGIRKFLDGLPGLCNPSITDPTTAGSCALAANNLGQYIPLAIPDTSTFTVANGFAADADYYVIAVVQHREQMHTDLPPTLLRQYVQLETPANAAWSKHVPLQTDLVDGTSVPTLMPDGSQAYAVDEPHFLGPVIVATKDRAVRIVFYNLLPAGAAGDFFLPKDSTIMGSGMGPMDMMAPMDDGTVLDEVRNPVCTDDPSNMMCFVDNRATLHLHGGNTPWISDGTPHQWITPANESTSWPQGVSVTEVPDMVGATGVPDCSGANDGCQTFYYTNQQSARLMFYHDHAWGITRLNVYAGEAAGYLITDPAEQALVAGGIIPADQIPLVIQDRTFVPGPEQLSWQDPTWNTTRWGSMGSLWYHHVYMPAQNPGDPGGMSAFGRWMYGPWFWPPADPQHGPISNPYYNPTCLLDDPATWTYDTDPFCEPEEIPGTPNISVGMEQFNDTPIVNGTAYPTLTLEPKAYRLRILSAANDRFWNLQWYVADATGTEVALNPTELALAQTDPVVSPTPDTTISPPGPNWIQIGTEGGFLPAPVVVKNQPITWITDPTRFDVGNVDQHSLLLAPAERADVIVDFSAFAGKTLILYNDAPAAFPARVASYDYYTGGPDMYPVGVPTILPGYGPNTRTVMQVKIAGSAPAPAFNLNALKTAFKHHANGSGVFESSQNPVIVGQAAYNSAYGTQFPASGYCNGGSTSTKCDGFLRISDQGGTLFGFNTLKNQLAKMAVMIEPKAIHDEMNASSFDEFGRMTANLGLEVVPATPGTQNVVLCPYVNPPTELFDGTNLPVADVYVTPIATNDGTQIWKITHNGVDTHPIHFHLYDVQLLNRVTWDNIVIPPDATELGWKDTIRISPLEDTIVAIRPIMPKVPFELPNSIRPLNPMMPLGSLLGFNSTDTAGNPTAPLVNQLINFGMEYVWHCHILSHEEMDMMRPVSVAVPPNAPGGLASSVAFEGVVLTWDDNSINETEFVVQRDDGSSTWTDLGTDTSPLDQPNVHGVRTFTDGTTTPGTAYQYRVVARNGVGLGGAYPSLYVQSISDPLDVVGPPDPPNAPTNLNLAVQGSLANGPRIRVRFKDNAVNETGFMIERSTDAGATFSLLVSLPASANTGTVTYYDAAVVAGTTYTYRVYATIGPRPSAYSATVSAALPPAPAAPSGFAGIAFATGANTATVTVAWVDNSNNESRFAVQRAADPAFTTGLVTAYPGANKTSLSQTGLQRGTSFYYRIAAQNLYGYSIWVALSPSPIVTP